MANGSIALQIMGCTSSAPNMTSPKLNTAEMSIQFEEYINDEPKSGVEEIIYRADENNKNEIYVLPSCDTVAEPLNNIVRNKSTPSIKSGTDHVNNDKTKHDEDKKTKLEEVVEKAVELYIENTDEIHEPIQKKGEEFVMVEDKNDKANKKEEPTDDTGNKPNEEKEDPTSVPEGALSPSQSESSRATRWEALADIAAELPASLAVDPITGQIYALAK